MVVELRGRGSPVRRHGRGTTAAAAHSLASCIGGVKLLLKVVKLLGVVGVRGGGTRAAAHDRGVFVVAVAGAHPARRQGLGGVWTAAATATAACTSSRGRTSHTHRRGL